MNRWLIHSFVLIALLTLAGCSKKPVERVEPAPLPSDPAAPVPSPVPARELPPRPEVLESVTPEQILHGMVDVYRKAKFYSDRGVIQTVYLRDDGSSRQKPFLVR